MPKTKKNSSRHSSRHTNKNSSDILTSRIDINNVNNNFKKSKWSVLSTL